MKRFLPIVSILAVLVLGPVSAATAADSHTVTVDYVIGMLQAGMNQSAIVAHILDRDLAFRLVAGDIDRLRAAGAGDELVGTVTREGVMLENSPGAGSASGQVTTTAPEGGMKGAGVERSRPRRMGGGEPTISPNTQDEGESPYGDDDVESQDDSGADDYGNYGDYYAYYYHPGYYDPSYYYSPYFYGYYAYPYYYPSFYYSPFRHYYGYPYYNFSHGVRSVPRGLVRGRPGPSTPGGQVAPRGAPHGGSGHSSPGGHGSGAAPRGGHGHH